MRFNTSSRSLSGNDAVIAFAEANRNAANAALDISIVLSTTTSNVSFVLVSCFPVLPPEGATVVGF